MNGDAERKTPKGSFLSQTPIQQDVAYLSGWQSAVEAPVSILNRDLSLYLLPFHPHLPPPPTELLWDQLSFNLAAVGS